MPSSCSTAVQKPPRESKDVDPTETLAALVAEANSPDHRLSAPGFAALVAALNAARCCRLTYSDFGRASDALNELCR